MLIFFQNCLDTIYQSMRVLKMANFELSSISKKLKCFRTFESYFPRQLNIEFIWTKYKESRNFTTVGTLTLLTEIGSRRRHSNGCKALSSKVENPGLDRLNSHVVVFLSLSKNFNLFGDTEMAVMNDFCSFLHWKTKQFHKPDSFCYWEAPMLSNEGRGNL